MSFVFSQNHRLSNDRNIHPMIILDKNVLYIWVKYFVRLLSNELVQEKLEMFYPERIFN